MQKWERNNTRVRWFALLRFALACEQALWGALAVAWVSGLPKGLGERRFPLFPRNAWYSGYSGGRPGKGSRACNYVSAIWISPPIPCGSSLACERQTFLLTHRHWGTFRWARRTSAVRRLAPRRLSCQISASQREPEMSANVKTLKNTCQG